MSKSAWLSPKNNLSCLHKMETEIKSDVSERAVADRTVEA